MKNIKRLLAIIAMALMVWTAWVMAYSRNANTTAAYYTPSNNGIVRAEMQSSLSYFRIDNNLQKLETNEKLMKTAYDYACEMAATQRFSHYQLNGDGPAERARANWYSSLGIGENIYSNTNRTTTAMTALNARIASPWHLANMMDPDWNEVWVWYCSWYRVQLFWENEFINFTKTAPVCENAIEENSFKYRFENHRTACIPVWYTSMPAPTPIPLSAMYRTPAQIAATPVTSLQQKLVDKLNKLYSRVWNGKKLYLK